jgi:uncharacterized protein (DUF488 family)
VSAGDARATGQTGRYPVATIGYEGAALEDFLRTLKDAGIATLVDIRALPWSRRPEFTRRALAEACASADIGYLHLGALGNPEEGRAAAKAGRHDEFRRIYEAQLDFAAGRNALARLAERAAGEPVALMCMERDPARCHRSIAAARLVAMLGVEIRHLIVGESPADLPLFRDL